jgi:hypothetical protein
MPIWLVIVVPCLGVRYIDSAWATVDAAEQRLVRIRWAFDASSNGAQGNLSHCAFRCQATLENCELHQKPGRPKKGTKANA